MEGEGVENGWAIVGCETSEARGNQPGLPDISCQHQTAGAGQASQITSQRRAQRLTGDIHLCG